MDDLRGLDALMATLEQAGADGMTLAGENVGRMLSTGKEHGVPFEAAWSMAINRVQPPQQGGTVDDDLAASMREDRTLLEEIRPHFRAAYEGTPVSARDRAESVTAAWRRLDMPAEAVRRRTG